MAIFDPIINSEDEMIGRAGIKKHYACAYLRAYIMASLCFDPQFVVSDSSANLNRAFRTLIDPLEGCGYYHEDFVIADFEWLIREGHIRFAVRDTFEGNFSEALRQFQIGKRNVDHPSDRYTRKIDEICTNENVYWYSTEEISKLFTSKFMDKIKVELNKDSIPLEWVGLFKDLISRLSDKETIAYSDVKNILKERHSEKDAEYQYIRKLLRQSYDYNVPALLGLDCCMDMQGIKPSRNQDWMLKASIDLSVPWELLCNVYGLFELPVSHLKYIWGSKEYENFRQQINCIRAGTIELNEYVVSLENYIRKVNEVVSDIYTAKHKRYLQYEKGKISSVRPKLQLYKAVDKSVLVAQIFNDIREIANIITGPVSYILDKVLFNIISELGNKGRSIPEPPEEINEAIILNNKTEKDVHGDTETKQGHRGNF